MRLTNNIKSLLLIVLLTGPFRLLNAQADGSHEVLLKMLPYIFLVAVGLIIAYGAKTIYDLTILFIEVKERQIREKMGLPPVAEKAAKKESWWSRFYKKATDAVPIAQEADVMLDND